MACVFGKWTKNRPSLKMPEKSGFRYSLTRAGRGQFTYNPAMGGPAPSAALPWIKDDKAIGIADEDAPEKYRTQQPILRGC
jgi:hypothetical protein